MTIRQIVAAAAVVSILAARPSVAQETAEPTAHSGLGFGAKAGFGIQPDQFVFGAQYSLGKSLGIFRVVPNAHLGVGDDTTLDLNADFLLRLLVQDAGIGLYGGAAPTIVLADDTEFGGTAVVGVQLPLIKGRATNLEARFGIGHVPDFRLLGTVVF
jgi:hypothetical protein